MKRNRLFSLLAVLLVLTLLVSCGNTGTAEPTDPTPTVTAVPAATDVPDAEPTTVPAVDPVATDAPAPSGGEDTVPEKYEHFSANGIATSDNGYMREDLTSLELVTLMGNGTNLGNTMEAYGRATYGTSADVSSYETFWGQPETTQEMLTALKAAGFNSIRIPIAWTNAMDFETGDYTIGADYLDRVEEIINYALNEDMYVVINDHWDGGWWGMFGSATESTRETAMDLYVSMWTQIAERYKEYSDYLIFESANEELGNRLNDIDLCPDSGTLSVDECYEMANKINQTFVDVVRGTGGNNEQRFLLIAGSNTDIESTCDDRFKMPTDTAENKLLISVHYYEPFGYCGSASLSTWGSTQDYEKQNTLLQMMTKFTEQGYGVIIGEWHVALNSDGTVKENTCEFLNNFLDNTDLYGYCPMFWDCSTHFIRRELSFLDENVAEVFASRSLEAQSSLSEEEIKANAAASIAAALENASAGAALEENKAIAWIMYNSSDWNTLYSVGDVYAPDSKTEGIVATDVEITGEGTYTVGLDFTGIAGGYANGVVFSALAIGNGELLFPGYVIAIKEIKVNGEPYTMQGLPYTTSDDNICTRVNLYNAWVTSVPTGIRMANGIPSFATPCLLNADTLGNVETLEVTFEYINPND